MGKKAERLTLLIVEDEPSTREGFAELLERDGYRVITAADEREAVQSARLETPDLILVELGVTVPELLSVGERVRAEVEADSEIPIVAYAGGPSEIVDEGEEVPMGDNQYVTLPEDFSQLADLIERLLRAA
ncbi:MAG TPA: response regulator [Pyrinomonadaceae bacterium]|nr:response regulator [Pyrinomonadaceae bacterium]